MDTIAPNPSSPDLQFAWFSRQGAEVRLYVLSDKQKQMVIDAIGDGSDWPGATADPLVNHRVDQLVMKQAFPDDPNEWIPAWDQLSKEEQEMYREEAKLNRS